jgi:hypothetical protein
VYDPGAGRFLQTDPIGYEGGGNLYAYVSDDPLDLVDSMGTCQSMGGCDQTIRTASGGSLYIPSDSNQEMVITPAPLLKHLADMGSIGSGSFLTWNPSGTCIAYGGDQAECGVVSNAMIAQSNWTGGTMLGSAAVGLALGPVVAWAGPPVVAFASDVAADVVLPKSPKAAWDIAIRAIDLFQGFGEPDITKITPPQMEPTPAEAPGPRIDPTDLPKSPR